MLVVDTNVIAYLFLAGDRTKEAQALFAADDDWHTEGFALVELSNLLATACRTRGLTSVRARRVLKDAEDLLRGRTHDVSHQIALAFASEYSISAYDARFIALAEQLALPLITEDARLRRAVPDGALSIAAALTQ